MTPKTRARRVRGMMGGILVTTVWIVASGERPDQPTKVAGAKRDEARWRGVEDVGHGAPRAGLGVELTLSATQAVVRSERAHAQLAQHPALRGARLEPAPQATTASLTPSSPGELMARPLWEALQRHRAPLQHMSHLTQDARHISERAILKIEPEVRVEALMRALYTSGQAQMTQLELVVGAWEDARVVRVDVPKLKMAKRPDPTWPAQALGHQGDLPRGCVAATLELDAQGATLRMELDVESDVADAQVSTLARGPWTLRRSGSEEAPSPTHALERSEAALLWGELHPLSDVLCSWLVLAPSMELTYEQLEPWLIAARRSTNDRAHALYMSATLGRGAPHEDRRWPQRESISAQALKREIERFLAPP